MTARELVVLILLPSLSHVRAYWRTKQLPDANELTLFAQSSCRSLQQTVLTHSWFCQILLIRSTTLKVFSQKERERVHIDGLAAPYLLILTYSTITYLHRGQVQRKALCNGFQSTELRRHCWLSPAEKILLIDEYHGIKIELYDRQIRRKTAGRSQPRHRHNRAKSRLKRPLR